jgi:hypothetical protein
MIVWKFSVTIDSDYISSDNKNLTPNRVYPVLVYLAGDQCDDYVAVCDDTGKITYVNYLHVRVAFIEGGNSNG